MSLAELPGCDLARSNRKVSYLGSSGARCLNIHALHLALLRKGSALVWLLLLSSIFAQSPPLGASVRFRQSSQGTQAAAAQKDSMKGSKACNGRLRRAGPHPLLSLTASARHLHEMESTRASCETRWVHLDHACGPGEMSKLAAVVHRRTTHQKNPAPRP